MPIDYPWPQAGYSLSYLGHSTRHETWPNPPFQPARPMEFERGQCRHHPGTRRFSATMPDSCGNATSLGRFGRERFEHIMGASTCEYPSLIKRYHAIPCHSLLICTCKPGGLHRSLRRHFCGVPKGSGVFITPAPNLGLSNSLSERAAVLPAFSGPS